MYNTCSKFSRFWLCHMQNTKYALCASKYGASYSPHGLNSSRKPFSTIWSWVYTLLPVLVLKDIYMRAIFINKGSPIWNRLMLGFQYKLLHSLKENVSIARLWTEGISGCCSSLRNTCLFPQLNCPFLAELKWEEDVISRHLLNIVYIIIKHTRNIMSKIFCYM